MERKKMSRTEYMQLSSSSDQWIPAQYMADSYPEWMQNIPKEKIHSVYASASSIPSMSDDGRTIVGGMDIFRYAEPRDQVLLNKDHVLIVQDGDGKDKFLIDGPYKDHEHWINDIPKRLIGANLIEIQGAKKRKKRVWSWCNLRPD